jgi:DNA-binding MarR family transcriptional regulator
MSTVARLRTRPAPLTTSKQRLRLWLRLLRASRAIEAKLRDKLRTTFGVTLPQFDVMAALARHDDGMTMSALSRELMVSNGNVTGIIDRLVTDKLVARKALAEDRRTFIVRLTPKGSAQFDGMAKIHEQWIDEMLGDVGDAEAAGLIARFDGLATHVRKGDAHP